MNSIFAFAADLLVAILLVATIATSVRLSRRIAHLKADEAALRTTISDLMAASETAERAIGGLRATLGECDRTLAERLRAAERYGTDLADQVSAGEAIMTRIARIAETSRRAVEATEPASDCAAGTGDNLKAAVLAARAVAERSAQRRESRAA